MKHRPRALVAVTLVFALLVAAIAWLRLGPLPDGLVDHGRYVSPQIVDRHGVMLLDALSDSGTRSERVEPASLPPLIVAATVAAEDHRFFRHSGVDPVGVIRAMARNVRSRRVVEGGSTITQQTAKLLLQEEQAASSRWRAKMREAVVALRLEHRLTKEEILALYLTIAPYGNQYIGAERAARGYFGVSARQLTVAQSAFLAGLPQRPSRLDPYRRSSAAAARQRVVLRRMQETGHLDEEGYRVAAAERITLRRPSRNLIAPHFNERAMETARRLIDGKPLLVETTLDAALQRDVSGIIATHRKMLARHGAHNVAVVVLDNRSGEWLAWEGSGDYFDSQHGGAIDGAVSLRQPGSALKPFTYAVAFDSGYTPASVLPDLATHFPTAVEGVVYAPGNYDGRFRGPVRARAALAGSLNVPAVWLTDRIGPAALLRLLRSAGLTGLERSADYYGLGLTLGGAETRLDQLVAAYAMFARDGEFQPPRMIRRLTDAEGREHVPPVEPPRRLISPRAAFWVSDILSDSEARSFVFGRGGSLEFPFDVAVKTGTSQAYHDNWTIGYTSDVTVGVWVGNFDRRPLRNSSGVTGAAPIFHAVMMAAQQRIRDGRREGDEGLTLAPDRTTERSMICLLSGMSSTGGCPATGSEWLPVGATDERCSWHRVSLREVDGRQERQVVVDWPLEFRQWGERQQPSARAAVGGSRTVADAAGRLRIASPPNGASYLIDPTLRREFQTLQLRALVPDGAAVDWMVGNERVGSTRGSEALRWPLRPGEHEIAAIDATGRRATSRITVK
jgi:penicillin-binding protein 1C